MTWTLVQKSTAAGSGSASVGSASTAGNLLVACIIDADEASTVTAPSGWVKAIQGAQAFAGSAGIWYYPNNPGGISSVTFSDTTSNLTDGWMAEFTASGVASAALDSTGTGSQSSATSCPVTATSSSAAGDLAVACFAWAGFSGLTWSTPSGWTLLGDDTGGTGDGWSGYVLSVSAGTLSVTGATATGSAAAWSGALATFSAGGGGSPAVSSSAFMAFLA